MIVRIGDMLSAALACGLVLIVGVASVPLLFAGRVLPGITVGASALGGTPKDQLATTLAAQTNTFIAQPVTLHVRGHDVTHPLKDFGVQVKLPATQQAIERTRWIDVLAGYGHITPRLTVATDQFDQKIDTDFATVLTAPRNATLELTANDQFTVVPSKIGEGVDIQAFARELTYQMERMAHPQPIVLQSTPRLPDVRDTEVDTARAIATTLLHDGFTLQGENDQTWPMVPFTIRRLLTFVPQPDPHNPSNIVLGVKLDPPGLQDFLQTTIAPQVTQPAQDARFEMVDGRVQQFATPQLGKDLDIPTTTDHIETALAEGQTTAAAQIAVTQPDISSLSDIQSLGVTTLLARGETDFSGSPNNRITNITVGTTHYQGLLIPPGTEFSFLKYLGPVDASGGYKPELVIKNNATIPEYGGGLCQVSTTLFRAVVMAGLPVTERRNHAYIVRYYGTAGFDATIYPPYTDLKFKNDTPGYILIQTQIEGKHLIFELWGTSDGRQVAIDGPVVYDRQPDGSAKATLHEKVTKGDAVLTDTTFYSRYKSPALYPHTDVPLPPTP